MTAKSVPRAKEEKNDSDNNSYCRTGRSRVLHRKVFQEDFFRERAVLFRQWSELSDKGQGSQSAVIARATEFSFRFFSPLTFRLPDQSTSGVGCELSERTTDKGQHLREVPFLSS